MVKKSNAQVIVPANLSSPPEPHEKEIAEILSKHYDSTIEFIAPINDYKRKTPDIVMNGVLWEIKSPIGNSKRHTVSYQFDRASKQSKCLIFDGRRTKLPDDFLKKRIVFELNKHKSIKRLVFITKSQKILEIK
jgi:hypothetical protein